MTPDREQKAVSRVPAVDAGAKSSSDVWPEGNAILYCEGAYGTTSGKTAHGLVRRSHRYHVTSVIDSTLAGRDAGGALDGRIAGIPIVASLPAAIAAARRAGFPATHLVVGLAPDGGRLSDSAREHIAQALVAGLHVDSGLHDFLSEDPELFSLATGRAVRIRDIRKPPPRHRLHFFSGKIEQVTGLKVAVLGTDSAVGKRTTAWLVVDGLEQAGFHAEFVGTGQTAWLQGARYGVVLDSLVNDFVSGEIEHAVFSAWEEQHPDVILIEGQGSLLNPAYPGGFEILAAARPDVVVLQHAPARAHYDGFPQCPMHTLKRQIEAIELVSGKPVVAIAINGAQLTEAKLAREIAKIGEQTWLPVCAPLLEGVDPLLGSLVSRMGY